MRAAARRFFLWKTRGTSTVGWLAGPWRTPEDRFEAGRMLLRLWLELTRHGLYMQPFGSVVTNPRSHALMAERLNVDESQRRGLAPAPVGYCAPPPAACGAPARRSSRDRACRNARKAGRRSSASSIRRAGSGVLSSRTHGRQAASPGLRGRTLAARQVALWLLYEEPGRAFPPTSTVWEEHGSPRGDPRRPRP